MNKEMDYNYLAESLASLCGIPVRLYKNGTEVFYFPVVNLKKDPFVLVKDEVLKYKDTVGYYSTRDFFYYGFLHFEDYELIIGPSRLINADDNTLNRMCMLLSLNKKESEDFKNSMNSIITMPLMSLIQALCTFAYAITKEKIMAKDVIIHGDDSDINNLSPVYENETENKPTVSNAYEIEKEIKNIIKNGDLVSLKSFVNTSHSIRPGVLSDNYLRQLKNIFIVTATVSSRSAIEGGMDVQKALSLSDLYIQKCETLTNEKSINNLSFQMVEEYTKEVSKIKADSSLLLNVNKYIYSHLSKMITIDELSDFLYISRSTLCNKFRKETNMTINEYVLNVKIKEAQELLRENKMGILAISQYLGFSSQSHFNKVFKKVTGITPHRYRKCS